MGPSAGQIQGESYLGLKLWFGLKVFLGSKGISVCTGPQLVLERTFQNKNLQKDISNEHKTPLKDVKPARMENRNQIR